MPRPLLLRSSIHPYHVTSRTWDKEFFPLKLSRVWEILIHQLRIEIKEQGLAVHGFILMGNHFHLLCQTPKENLDKIMHQFLRMSSIRINLETDEKIHHWQERYRWSLIQSRAHYYQVYRYIYQNPIRACLCQRVEAYPFSTLHPTNLPLHSHFPLSFAGEEGHLRWLNDIFDENHTHLIKLGLRKSQFDVSKKNVVFFNRLNSP